VMRVTKSVPTIAALQILGRENRLQYRPPFRRLRRRIDRSGVDIGDTPNSAGFCGRIRMLHPNSTPVWNHRSRRSHLKKRGEPYHPAVDLLHAWPKKAVTTTLRRSLTAAPRWTALDKLSAAPWGVNRSPNRSSRFQHLKRGIQDASLSLSL